MKESGDKFHIDFVENGIAYGSRERPDGSFEQATLEKPVDGVPLRDGQEVVQTSKESRDTLRIQTLYKHKGPARASNPAYRAGYDEIFGKQKVAEA